MAAFTSCNRSGGKGRNWLFSQGKQGAKLSSLTKDLQMSDRLNQYNQPIGPHVPDWRGAKHPTPSPLVGRYCRLEGLDPSHASDLFDAFATDTGGLWTYMAVGPFATRAEFGAWLKQAASGTDPLFYAVIDRQTNRALGLAAYLRIKPALGVIEVGSITFAPQLQRTRAATEAMFLMMQHAFDLGYRRYEWKCDALNAPSRQAAKRFGFSYDGLFKQALVYKGRNRDTAWYSLLDQDWPRIKAGFETWLAPENFDANGQQKNRLNIG